jgi:8-oxo-dGTP pyrophosphatase MutT (NUDIX family)
MAISSYLRDLRQKVGNIPLMVPAVTALVVNDQNRVLLHRACDDGKWHTVGGSIDPLEEPADAAARETLEETGLHIEPVCVVGVYADPPVTYPNGDVVLYTSIAFECRILGGQLHPADDESLELGFFAADDLPELSELDREKVLRVLDKNTRTHFRRRTDHLGEG